MEKITYPTPAATLPCSLARNTYRSDDIELIEWQALAELIRTDKDIEKSTSYARSLLAAGDDKGFASAKCKCGAFIPAAQFSGGRKREHITALTGVSMVDLDHVPDHKMADTLAAIAADPHTFMAYTTTSGHGIRVLFRYTCQQPQTAYIDAWCWGNEYYSMLTDLPHDEATKDPTRLSFLCHDPRCLFRPDAVPFRIISNDEVLAMADEQPASCADLAQQIADRHIPFAEGSRHQNLRYRAFLMNKMGCSADEIAASLEPHAPRGRAEAEGLAQWVADRGKADFGTWKERPAPRHDKKRRPLAAQQADEPAPTAASAKAATPEEIRQYLTSRGLLRFNTLCAAVEVWSHEDEAFVAVNDRTVNSIWHDANTALGKYVKPQDFDRELNSDAVPLFRPVEEYFDALPPWDGQDHIAALAARVHTTTSADLFETCFRKWLTGMAASWLDPQVLNQNILTLIGGQGLYKSTFFRRLLPPELARYFMAKGNSTYVSKDDKLAVSSYLLIDFEEIDSMKDADLNAVKALVTTEVIAERAAYARNRENRPHLASFCATGNNRSFLTDLTGNRRWLPFEVQSIDSPYDHPVDYEQLYAQALHLIRSGYQYWFSREEDLALEAHKNTFTEPCLEEEQLQRYYRKPEHMEAGAFLTTTEIVARCSADLRGMLSTKKMGQALKRCGFASKAANGRRGYILVERTYEEINMGRINAATDILRQEKAAREAKQLTIESVQEYE